MMMAAASDRKILIETSAVPPVLGFSNNPHNKYVQELFASDSLATSVYVRMETIRVWVCDAIAFAELASQCSLVSDAINFWSHQFGRKPKIAVQLWGWISAGNSEIRLSDTQVKEFVLEVCHKALAFMQVFDLKLASRTNNSCGCEIGGVPLDPDYRNLLRDLSEFRKRFLTDVVDCKINRFLGMDKPKGRINVLAACADISTDPKILDPIKKVVAQSHVTCSNCKTIGDQVISLEHTASKTLIHVDNSFNALCECSGHPHQQIRSAASFKPLVP